MSNEATEKDREAAASIASDLFGTVNLGIRVMLIEIGEKCIAHGRELGILHERSRASASVDRDSVVKALAEIEQRFESVVFDEFQRRDADNVLTILQTIIATFLKAEQERAKK